MVVRGVLKFLGGLLAALLILAVVLGVAGFFAVRNFDPNMFRTEFEKYITQQTGFRAELGTIKFQWRPQPQLQVAGLKFYHPQSLEKILQSNEVRIDADLTSLLQKHFTVSQIVIQNPEIFLRRSKQGAWNWEFVKVPAASVADPVPMLSKMSFIPTAEAAERTEAISLKNLGDVGRGWNFGIRKILARDATVHIVDETVEPAFTFEIEKLDVEVRQKGAASEFHFTAGGSILQSAKRNLEAEGDLDLASMSLDLVLRYGPEKAVFKGMIKGMNAQPHFEGALEITDLDIEPLIPATYKKGDYVTGRLSAKTALAFDGKDPSGIQRSLDGQGTIEIRDGAVRNRNLVKEVFDRLSPVLAVTSALGGELPPEVSEMLKDRDTPFESLQVVSAVKTGDVRVSQIRLVHANYQLSGQGNYGIQSKKVDGSMALLLSPSISSYLMKKIREMELLADSNGQIMIPFRYTGIYPDASVQPDLAYMGAKLLQGGTDQLLSRGLEIFSKKMGSKKVGQVASVGSSVLRSPGAQQTSSAGPVSEEDQLIQQGLALFSKYREAKKQ